MNRSTIAWLSTAMLSASAGLLHAQDTVPASAGSSQQPAQPAAAPSPLAWHGTVNFGITLAAGVQSQRGYNFSVGVKRPFSDEGSFVAQAGRQYENVTFPDESLLADRSSFAIGLDEDITRHTVAMVRSLYLRDRLMLVNSRYEELLGYGLRLRNQKKTIELMLVPGLSVFNEDLTFTGAQDQGWQSAGGFFEKFTGKFNNVWSVENSFRFRHNFTGVDHSTESLASVSGMFTKALGLQLELQYNYESVVPDDFPNYIVVLSAGLKFQF
ncbi:MAG: DUF481 domain-containing protein [Acidobacteriota bacterium]